MKLSDAMIDMVIEKAEGAWRHNNLPKTRKNNYLLTLRTYLTQSGLIENVCHTCLGTGKSHNCIRQANEAGRRTSKMKERIYGIFLENVKGGEKT